MTDTDGPAGPERPTRARRGTSWSGGPGPRARRRRWARSPRTRRCGCCCWTAATSPGTSPAATASRPHVLDALATVGAGDVVDDWTPLRLPRVLARGRGASMARCARAVHVVPRQVLDTRLVELRRRRRGDAAPAPGAPRSPRHPTVARSSCRPGSRRGSWSAPTVRTRSSAPCSLGDRREARAIAIRGYAPTTPELQGRQLIRYGERRQPSYAWAFDRGDGLMNVGYGELLPASGATRGRPRAAGCSSSSSRCWCPGPPPSGSGWRGHHLPLSSWLWRSAGRAGAAGRGRRRAGQPDDGGGDLLRGRDRHHRGPDRRPDPGRRSTARRRCRAPPRRARAPGTAPAPHVARVPAGKVAGGGRRGDPRRGGGTGAAFDTLVELGLGDGLIGPRLAGGLLASLVRR